MYLSSFAMTEPQDSLYLYYPSWLNTWESHVHNLSLKSTNANAWAFKRFGMNEAGYARERLRKPDCKAYIDALNDVSDAALTQLSDKVRMSLMKSRTAFIYSDAWGESGVFESAITPLYMTIMNTAPRLLIQKFAAKDFSCKIRSEKHALIQAMQLAEDYLEWDVFDYVVICAAFRAVPLLVFSEEDLPVTKKDRDKSQRMKTNLCIERIGCFIFSRHESEVKVNCGHYTVPNDNPEAYRELLGKGADINFIAYAGLRKNRYLRSQLAEQQRMGIHSIDLIELYGASGCLSPALSWIYRQQHPDVKGKMRTIVPDNFGGYHYFDAVY